MPDEKKTEAFNAFVEHVAAGAAAATWPLYSQDGEMVFRHLGTAIPLQVGKKYFVITAAHVADQAKRERVFIAQDSEMVDLGQAAVSTHLPKGGTRKDDSLDVAVFYLTESQGRRLGDEGVVRAGDLDLTPAPITDDDYLLTMGYPHKKQDARIRGGSLDCYLYRFITLASGRADYETLSVSSTTRVVLTFQKKRMYNKGLQVTAPDLYGISGGGVWRLPTDPHDPFNARPKLCAIAVEWRRQPPERVLATRLIVPISAIWRDHPELRIFLRS